MIVLTPAARMQLETWLADARQQQHLLLTGQAAKVFVDQNGERVEYQMASAQRLAAYIAELERKLGLTCAGGPLNIWF